VITRCALWANLHPVAFATSETILSKIILPAPYRVSNIAQKHNLLATHDACPDRLSCEMIAFLPHKAQLFVCWRAIGNCPDQISVGFPLAATRQSAIETSILDRSTRGERGVD
jgi:hypothetical protein